MLEITFNTLRNIGLGIFVNGAFILQFGESTTSACYAIIEGIVLMFGAGYGELRYKRIKNDR